MAVIDALAGDLVDVDTLLRWITDELVANHRFTARFGDVNAGLPFTVTDTLRWLDRPQAETFYQDSDILWGIRNSDSIRGQDSSTISIGLQLGNALWSAIGEPGSGNRWNDTTWTQDASVIPNFSPDMRDDGSTNGCCPMGVDRLDSGSVIGARMITSPTSGSATPSEPLYFYIVVEYAIGKFRKFGFGELCKYYDWEGGIFCMGDIYGSSNASGLYNSTRSLFGSGNGGGSATDNFRDEAAGVIYAPGWTGILKTDGLNGRGWMTNQSVGDIGTSDGQNAWPALGWDARMGGIQFIGQSPSSFSLQSERVPAVLFGGNQKFDSGVDFEVHPMGAYPDLFQAVITNVDAYGVFADTDGQKYMVVPHINKLIDESTTSSEGSGRHGLLIRNPALVTTI